MNQFFSFDIIPYTTEKTFRAGELILEEGSLVNHLVFLEKGTVKCMETQQNGKMILFAYLYSPTFIGDLELMNARTSAAGIYAITDCKCKIIRLEECKERILQDVTFLRYMCKSLAEKTVRNEKNLAIGQTYPLKNRLATFILDTQNSGKYTQPHTEVAAYLGVSYRHLLYVIAQFVDEGMLQKNRSGYQIQNRKALEELYISVIE